MDRHPRKDFMIKKITLTLFLLLSISACGDDKVDTNDASNTSTLKSTSGNKNISDNAHANIATDENANGEEVELTEQDILAMDLLNEEMFLDECNAYAKEDNVTKEEMDAYLNDCVEQLKLQASIIIDAPDEEQQTEDTPPTTTKTPETPK